MAGVKEIKDRMKSIRDTQKITNAMYLISSTKLQKAKSEREKTNPYFEALRKEIRSIFRSTEEVDSRYFYPDADAETDEGTFGLLVITADKGLAGAYNQNVIKKAELLMREHPDTKLYVVGEYGRQYFLRKHIPIEHSFLYTAQNPTMQRAREISSILLDRFDKDELDKIFMIYTEMKSSMNAEANTTRLLPFHRSHFMTKEQQPVENNKEEYEFFPSWGELLDNIMFSYVSGYIYSALVDSFCSEQNARMTAMSSANENAEKILGELAIQYNHVRQANITQEITEVVAGAKAQKKKRMREVSG
ncbi:MAG: ATP synthase F1 subunit gamma [Eubacteriales bacterium]|nr:ATP synthase F1 subunit gamma [Eubacteriales bacterium]